MILVGDDGVVPLTFTVEAALDLAALAHEGQRDRSGAPYIDHLRRVSAGAMRYAMELGDPVVVRSPALSGHCATSLRILPTIEMRSPKRGVPQRAINAIKLLTHAQGELRDEYVARLANSGTGVACALHTDLNRRADLDGEAAVQGRTTR